MVPAEDADLAQPLLPLSTASPLRDGLPDPTEFERDLAGETAPSPADSLAESDTAESDEPTDPGESTDPEQPTDPGGTTDPVDPGESTDPTEPTEPTDPAEPETPPEPTIVRGLSISGGVKDVDFTVKHINNLYVKTSTILEISMKPGASTTDMQILIPSGVEAWIILNNVTMSYSQSPIILRGENAKLHLILPCESSNIISCTGKEAGIHCGYGSQLWIDDELVNYDTATGEKFSVLSNRIGSDGIARNYVTNELVSVKKGDLATNLTSKRGKLGQLIVRGGEYSAAIGSGPNEIAGTMRFEGGFIRAIAWGGDSSNNGNDTTTYGVGTTNPQAKNSDKSSGAGIGAGGGKYAGASYTYFNGAHVEAYGSFHGAGVGAGWSKGDTSPQSGNSGGGTEIFAKRCGYIYINSGYVFTQGYQHGNAFGGSCGTDMTGCTVYVTGGTLRPFSKAGAGTSTSPTCDIGGKGGHITINGGSLSLTGSQSTEFQSGDGNRAYSSDKRTTEVRPVTINLTGETGQTDYDITKWELLIDGVPYEYGAPYCFNHGELTLWLPSTMVNKKITVNMSYFNSEKGEEVAVEPLERPANSSALLKRCVYIALPDGVLPSAIESQETLPPISNMPNDMLVDGQVPDPTTVYTKEYDGEPFDVNLQLPMDVVESKSQETRTFTDPEQISFRYRTLKGDALGTEVVSPTMPADSGLSQFALQSTEYAVGDWGKSYIGHRAVGWCRITPVPSKVALASAALEGVPGSQSIRVSASVASDAFPDGHLPASTCKAPHGRVQLYVDGVAVGEPVALTFSDEGSAKANALAIPNDLGGETTSLSLSFPVTDEAFSHEPTGPNGKHMASLMFLPPEDTSPDPANYLASANPAEAPDDVMQVPVALDPHPTVTPVPDPDRTDPVVPEPSVVVDPDPDPTGTDGDNVVYQGSIETTISDPTAGDPHPGRVILSVKTDSDAPISVTDNQGNRVTADFLRGPDGKPVKGADGSYTLVIDPVEPGRGTLTFKQEANDDYLGTTWVYDVTVKADPKIAPAPTLTKTVENLTHPGQAAHPGDVLRYTITAGNSVAGSSWNVVSLGDELPACVTLNEDSVHLSNPTDAFEGPLAKASAPERGEYSLSDPSPDTGRQLLWTPVGIVFGGSKAVLTFECTVKADAAGPGLSPSVDNSATAEGERPDPDDPEGTPLPVVPEPTPPVHPGPTDKVIPNSPDAAVAKTVENLTHPDGPTKVGDELRYTVTLTNQGPADSCLYQAAISDPLPEGLRPVPGSFTLTPVTGGDAIAVSDACWNEQTRTLAVACGDLWGGEGYALTFRCTVEAEAVGHSIANIADVLGTTPDEAADNGTLPGGNGDDGDDGPGTGPGEGDDDPGTEPGDGSGGAETVPGSPVPPGTPADPITSSDPVEPPALLPDDPDAGAVGVTKSVENLTRDDGTTRVQDTVRYAITASNTQVGSAWMDALIRDTVPRGIEPVPGTFRLTLPDGTELQPTDDIWDAETRRVAVSIGTLYGGTSAVLAFDALVTDEALDADIGNIGHVLGTLPSEWDPDGDHPSGGDPVRPPEGWDEFDQNHEVVGTDKVYPPGVDGDGGTLPFDPDDPGNGGAGDGAGDDEAGGKGIARRLKSWLTHLPQTGDLLRLEGLVLLALSLGAAALWLADRRRPKV